LQPRGSENIQETLSDDQTLPGIVLAGIKAYLWVGRQHIQQRMPDEVQKLWKARVRGANGILLKPRT